MLVERGKSPVDEMVSTNLLYTLQKKLHDCLTVQRSPFGLDSHSPSRKTSLVWGDSVFIIVECVGREGRVDGSRKVEAYHHCYRSLTGATRCGTGHVATRSMEAVGGWMLSGGKAVEENSSSRTFKPTAAMARAPTDVGLGPGACRRAAFAGTCVQLATAQRSTPTPLISCATPVPSEPFAHFTFNLCLDTQLAALLRRPLPQRSLHQPLDSAPRVSP